MCVWERRFYNKFLKKRHNNLQKKIIIICMKVNSYMGGLCAIKLINENKIVIMNDVILFTNELNRFWTLTPSLDWQWAPSMGWCLWEDMQNWRSSWPPVLFWSLTPRYRWPLKGAKLWSLEWVAMWNHLLWILMW